MLSMMYFCMLKNTISTGMTPKNATHIVLPASRVPPSCEKEEMKIGTVLNFSPVRITSGHKTSSSCP